MYIFREKVSFFIQIFHFGWVQGGNSGYFQTAGQHPGSWEDVLPTRKAFYSRRILSINVLFVGGALYAYGLDKHLKNYLESLDKNKVGKAVVFSTSWISRHSVDLIRKKLQEKGIPVEAGEIYYKNMPSKGQLAEAEKKAADIVKG